MSPCTSEQASSSFVDFPFDAFDPHQEVDFHHVDSANFSFDAREELQTRSAISSDPDVAYLSASSLCLEFGPSSQNNCRDLNHEV